MTSVDLAMQRNKDNTKCLVGISRGHKLVPFYSDAAFTRLAIVYGSNHVASRYDLIDPPARLIFLKQVTV
jgi:hypothetical protein